MLVPSPIHPASRSSRRPSPGSRRREASNSHHRRAPFAFAGPVLRRKHDGNVRQSTCAAARMRPKSCLLMCKRASHGRIQAVPISPQPTPIPVPPAKVGKADSAEPAAAEDPAPLRCKGKGAEVRAPCTRNEDPRDECLGAGREQAERGPNLWSAVAWQRFAILTHSLASCLAAAAVRGLPLLPS